MIAINFAAFPLSMGRRGARKVLAAFGVTSRLPGPGRIMVVAVPMSGALYVTAAGNDCFDIRAEPMEVEK